LASPVALIHKILGYENYTACTGSFYYIFCVPEKNRLVAALSRMLSEGGRGAVSRAKRFIINNIR